jgi:hypothetical protein
MSTKSGVADSFFVLAGNPAGAMFHELAMKIRQNEKHEPVSRAKVVLRPPSLNTHHRAVFISSYFHSRLKEKP